MPVRTVKLASLVEDFDLYPRHAVDSSHVRSIAEAIEAGQAGAIPPVVVDKATSRIVDGFHRARAWRKVLGRGGEIKADVRSYPDEASILKHAIELNAGHGRKFDQQDKARAALLLERQGVTVKEIGVMLRVGEPRARELLDVRVVLVKPKTGPAEKRPAKPVVYPAPGTTGLRTITEEQYKVMQSSSGHRTAQTVGQLIRELEAGLVDMSVPGLVGWLWRLHDVIEEVVPARATA